MVKVHGEEKQGTMMGDMEDGDIAVILDEPGYAGRVVQYVGDYRWVLLGEDSGSGWQNNYTQRAPTFRVQILPPGTLLEICGEE